MRTEHARTRARRASIVAVAAGALFVLTPSVALGSSNDNRASTRTYIDARYTFARASISNISAELSAIRAFTSRVEGECPGVLAGARPLAYPKQRAAIVEEMMAAVVLAELGPDRGALRAAARTIRNLRWTDRKLTRLVRREEQAVDALAGLRDPRLCTDLRAWATSSFRVLPAQTERFDRELTMEVATEGQDREEVIARLLRAYELPAERRTIRRTAMIDARHATATESTFWATLKAISVATGLGAPEPPLSG